jgi:hypothetical protein
MRAKDIRVASGLTELVDQPFGRHRPKRTPLTIKKA